MDYLMSFLNTNNIKNVTAKYIKTIKNEQVKDFYNKCSFLVTASNDEITEYELIIDNYKSKINKYIEVVYGKKN